MIQLLLQMVRMMIAYRFGQDRAEQTTDAPRQRGGSDHECERSSGGDDRSGRCRRSNIHQPADQPAFGTTDRFR